MIKDDREDMRKIGILSDTHGLLREEVVHSLQGCDVILHGGDINSREIIDRLEGIAPVYVVRGNNDKAWAEQIPAVLDFTLFGIRIFMTHKKKDLPKKLDEYDLAVYGHSHKYEEKREGRTLLVNPGSCGPRRWNQEITFAVLMLEEETGRMELERIVIPHQGSRTGKGESTADTATVRRQDIERVIREVGKGRPVAEISSRLGMPEELAEQICRLYLTHPGVDADGIMTKMGL